MAKASGTAAVGEGLRRGMGHGCMCYVLETVDATLNALPGCALLLAACPARKRTVAWVTSPRSVVWT